VINIFCFIQLGTKAFITIGLFVAATILDVPCN